MPHVSRPAHDWRHPVHITMRAKPGAPPLRTQRTLKIVYGALRELARRGEGKFRLNHFSVQSNHVHLIAEAEDRESLWRGVQWLAARVARRVNALVDRKGSLWRDRYHRHDLASPRAVRNALVYVLMNHRRHDVRARRPGADGAPPLDPCASAPWFAGWDPRAGPRVAQLQKQIGPWGLTASPVLRPETWLGAHAWRRGGLVRITELPRA